jgi:hypothetical protein
MSKLALAPPPGAAGRERGNQVLGDREGVGASRAIAAGRPLREAEQVAGGARTRPAGAVPGGRATLLRVAWLAVLLGLVIEALLLTVALYFGSLGDGKRFIADVVQKVSWSVLICVGLAFAGAASKGNPPTLGLTGLLAAPVAAVVARTLHKWMGQSIGLAMADPVGAAFFLIPTIRGLEYALLGAALAWLGRRPWGGALAHAALGLGVGVVFGGMVLAVNTPTSAAGLLSSAINEAVAPLGCALTLFAGQVLGKRAER